MSKLRLGDGFDEGVTQGPLINKAQFDKVGNVLGAQDIYTELPLKIHNLVFQNNGGSLR